MCVTEIMKPYSQPAETMKLISHGKIEWDQRIERN